MISNFVFGVIISDISNNPKNAKFYKVNNEKTILYEKIKLSLSHNRIDCYIDNSLVDTIFNKYLVEEVNLLFADRFQDDNPEIVAAFTEYVLDDGKKYCSEIYYNQNKYRREDVVRFRGLNEKVISIPAPVKNPPKSAVDYDMKGKYTALLHRVMYLLSINGDADLSHRMIKDNGLLHQIVHKMEKDNSLDISKDLYYFEQSVAGTYLWAKRD